MVSDPKCPFSWSVSITFLSLQIHIQSASVSLSAACLTADNKSQANTLPTGTTMKAVKLKKLMHRFTTEEVLRAMQEVGPGFGDLL